MISPIPSPAVPTPRQEIENLTQHPGQYLYTKPALEMAATLLTDLYATSERHGLTRSDFRIAGLDSAALSAVQFHLRDTGPSRATCGPLLAQLATALTERGLIARLLTEADDRGGVRYVAIERTDTMPPLGPNGWSSIWVGFSGDEPDRSMSWTAAVDLPRGPAPGCDIVAPYDATGVAAVADEIAAFAAGASRNPFRA